MNTVKNILKTGLTAGIRIALGVVCLSAAWVEASADEVYSARANAEARFISGLKTWDGTCDDYPEVNLTRAENYATNVLIVPGKYYHIPNVNNSTYYVDGENGVVLQLFDPEFAAESLANLFLLPIDEARETELDLTILTHNYGSSQRISTTVDQLMSYCEMAGCEVFFGIEKVEGDNVECAVFLYNPREGYDHVLRVACNAREVIERQATISANLSLFVPTDNVSALFQRMPKGKSGAGHYIEREGLEYER